MNTAFQLGKPRSLLDWGIRSKAEVYSDTLKAPVRSQWGEACKTLGRSHRSKLGKPQHTFQGRKAHWIFFLGKKYQVTMREAEGGGDPGQVTSVLRPGS